MRLFGTTNDSEFLRDPTGNRRFMPVDVVPNNAKKDVFMELDDEIDQIWAEAVVLYKSKEKLYLSHEAEKIAKMSKARTASRMNGKASLRRTWNVNSRTTGTQWTSTREETSWSMS